MKIFGVSRASAACVGAGLFVWAQASAFCQNFGTRPQMVATKTDAYLIGSTQMLVSAKAEFLPHPQGRYALIMQHGAAAMPGPLLGKSETGAASLFLYDSRLNQTRLIFQRRADTAKHQVEAVRWLPQTDCALVIVRDEKHTLPPNPPHNGSSNIGDESAEDAPPVEEKIDQTDTYTLLFFDFEKNPPPRVLATINDGGTLNVRVSPIKPVFLLETLHAADMDNAQDAPQYHSMNVKREVRMGSGPRGTLGPARQLSGSVDFSLSDVGWWSASGTSIYEIQSITTKPAPSEKLRVEEHWYEWDGQTPNAIELTKTPTDAMTAQKPKPQILPVMLRIGAVPVPTDGKRSGSLSAADALPVSPVQETKPNLPVTPSEEQAPPPDNPPPTKRRGFNDRQTILHPLYLEAVDAPETPDAASDQSALIAPDAPTAALLPDQSAVLYQSGGAVYAVPLVHLNGAAHARLQKTLAQQKAQTIGKAILMYTQDYDDIFPLQNNFADIVNPYVKDDALFQNFTYTNPNVPLGSVKFPATTIMGYLTAPGGRAVVYVDGHVQWKTQ